MLPVGLNVKLLNEIVSELRKSGLWAERHSYSIRIMYNGKFTASLHLYPGFNEAVLRLYGSREFNEAVFNAVKSLFSKYLPNYVLETTHIEVKL